MELPERFLEKMKILLKEEYDDFFNSYQEPRSQGLRVNTLKISIEEFLNISSFSLEKIPWVQEGFYYNEKDRPGKHPFHEAGLYYIQEPSAMAVGEVLDPKPGEKVLDLCAAPGGKTTHIAAKMEQRGLLIANEIHPARARILSQNVERMGIKNVVVLNEDPKDLSSRFPSFFDRILVDAPCSGEGMFRKDPDSCEEWSPENVQACSVRQLSILNEAGFMLKPGGRIVYSTCTFSPEENEGTISRFLGINRNFELEDVVVHEGFSNGKKDWIDVAAEHIEKTVRIWPHQVKGEGHFIAVLRKRDGEEPSPLKKNNNFVERKLLKDYEQFAKENLMETPTGVFITFGDQLYVLPEDMPSMTKLKVVRPGWHLGTLKKNRFEPSHAFALSLKDEQVKNTWNLEQDSDQIYSYLKGESIEAHGHKGWYLVEVNGFSIGWGKLTGQTLKNHYPKGLRWKN